MDNPFIDTETLTFVEIVLVPEALLRCRKAKNCGVPSSYFFTLYFCYDQGAPPPPPPRTSSAKSWEGGGSEDNSSSIYNNINTNSSAYNTTNTNSTAYNTTKLVVDLTAASALNRQVQDYGNSIRNNSMTC